MKAPSTRAGASVHAATEQVAGQGPVCPGPTRTQAATVFTDNPLTRSGTARML